MLSTTYSVRTLAHLTPVCLVKKVVAQIQKEINFAAYTHCFISNGPKSLFYYVLLTNSCL